MRMIVLMNRASGPRAARAREDEVRQELENAGLIVDLRPTPGHDLTKAARVAAGEGADAVVAAGGDGTISAVASALAGTQTLMGVYPIGTLNHFARDLGIPVNLRSAAATLASGHVRTVDVGEVNGRPFVNNSSIGLYPHIVRRRDEQCQRLGRGKWIAMMLAGISVFRRYPLLSVVLEANGETYPRTTPFVFVGNNRYTLDLLNLGERASLDGGRLSVYFAHRTGRFGLFRLMFRALLGRLEQAADFNSIEAGELRIDTPRPLLRVALDGEVHDLTPPLLYRIRPKSLNVIVP